MANLPMTELLNAHGLFGRAVSALVLDDGDLRARLTGALTEVGLTRAVPFNNTTGHAIPADLEAEIQDFIARTPQNLVPSMSNDDLKNAAEAIVYFDQRLAIAYHDVRP